MEATASKTKRRPILVWAIYILHCVLLGCVVWYVLTALRIVSVEEEFASRISNLTWTTRGITPFVFGLRYLGAHRLFFRKPKAIATYLWGPTLYLVYSTLMFLTTCVYEECPGVPFFNPTLFILFGFGFVLVLIMFALKSWPPINTTSRVDA